MPFPGWKKKTRVCVEIPSESIGLNDPDVDDKVRTGFLQQPEQSKPLDVTIVPISGEKEQGDGKEDLEKPAREIQKKEEGIKNYKRQGG